MYKIGTNPGRVLSESMMLLSEAALPRSVSSLHRLHYSFPIHALKSRLVPVGRRWHPRTDGQRPRGGSYRVEHKSRSQTHSCTFSGFLYSLSSSNGIVACRNSGSLPFLELLQTSIPGRDVQLCDASDVQLCDAWLANIKMIGGGSSIIRRSNGAL
jgi:hypothetical protein